MVVLAAATTAAAFSCLAVNINDAVSSGDISQRLEIIRFRNSDPVGRR